MKKVGTVFTVFCVILVVVIFLLNALATFVFMLSGYGDPAITDDFDMEEFLAWRVIGHVIFHIFTVFLFCFLAAGLILISRTLFSRIFMLVMNACQICLYSIVLLPHLLIPRVWDPNNYFPSGVFYPILFLFLLFLLPVAANGALLWIMVRLIKQQKAKPA